MQCESVCTNAMRLAAANKRAQMKTKKMHFRKTCLFLESFNFLQVIRCSSHALSIWGNQRALQQVSAMLAPGANHTCYGVCNRTPPFARWANCFRLPVIHNSLINIKIVSNCTQFACGANVSEAELGQPQTTTQHCGNGEEHTECHWEYLSILELFKY